MAAAVATYGAIALPIMAWTRVRARYAALGFAVLAALGVAISRVYLAVHHPTDAIASLLYASAWLAVCWHVLRPARGSRYGDGYPRADADRQGAVECVGSRRAAPFER